jgi:MoxR-like ATPase
LPHSPELQTLKTMPDSATLKSQDSNPLDAELREALARSIAQVNSVLLGKRHEVRLAFVCLLAGGHLLIEDLPGVGKTTLAHALAVTLGLDFHRVQFTSDLLPSDILGVSVYEREAGTFRFHPGPVFTQLLLADEINRATPKTQSALLEAMAEGQVSIDGRTHALPEPFFVVATQNPVDFAGTYPLPDSQLDRFMLRMSLGYPDAESERAMLASTDRRRLLEGLAACLRPAQILALQAATAGILASSALIEYVQSLLEASRQHAEVRVGLSPRAGLAILAAARAHALLAGRPYAVPEDVQAVFPYIAGHRLNLASSARAGRDEIVSVLIGKTPVR